MSNTAVDICNSALIKLGQERINTLNDNNKRARLCKEQYDRIIRKTLRGGNWGFAQKRTTLSTTGQTDWGELYKFPLPLDFVKMVQVENKFGYKYKLEAGDLVTPAADPINVKYISSDTAEYLYDACFMEAAACMLAYDLCYSLTQSTSLKDSLLQEFEYWVAQARSFDSQDQYPDEFEFDGWIDPRL
jgi:hypothetical protein